MFKLTLLKYSKFLIFKTRKNKYLNEHFKQHILDNTAKSILILMI